ncbi:MAG: PilZ domain-containing protein [Chloroflexi bacterium]|nr:PilZ domain-containing protein [Chloroflexota bacterium]MBT4305181.1 PilZ domain-containing protein [Chloroflexota bacterium]MBT6988594.1 PilZ domain-containing protein [Chloroflexota bacterium]
MTPKTVGDSVYVQERLSMSWYIGFVILISAAMINSVINIGQTASNLRADLYYVALAWAGYNALIITLALIEIFSKRHERKQYRFPAQGDVKIYYSDPEIKTINGQLVDISLSGVGIQTEEDISKNLEYLILEINPFNFEKITIPIKKIVSIRKSGNRKTILGLIFPEDLGTDNDLLYKYIFVHLPILAVNSVFKVNKFDPIKLIKNNLKKIAR